MSGWQSQQTGDVGHAIVRTELTRGGFLVGDFSPDPGEDLWAEVDDRRTIAESGFPRRAVFQVKATAAGREEFAHDFEVGDLKRWAAQPLPVFVVGVDRSTGQLFVKSVDEVIANDLGGRDLFELQNRTLRVRLEATGDLASVVRRSVERHYEPLQLDLSGVGDDEIKAHYFEVLQTKQPDDGDPVPIGSWSVLWKSSPRPQHFAAMISGLARRARESSLITQQRPALFVFHIFRSLEDRHYNLAVARVDFVNPDHPRAAELRDALKTKDGFRVRRDRDVEPVREFMQSKTVSAEEFRRHARDIGSRFDALSAKVIARGASGAAVWDEQMGREFADVDHLWNDGPLAPPECRALDRVLNDYFGCLLSHRHVELRRAEQLQPDVLRRLLRNDEARLAAFLGAWSVVLRSER